MIEDAPSRRQMRKRLHVCPTQVLANHREHFCFALGEGDLAGFPDGCPTAVGESCLGSVDGSSKLHRAFPPLNQERVDFRRPAGDRGEDKGRLKYWRGVKADQRRRRAKVCESVHNTSTDYSFTSSHCPTLRVSARP